MTAGAWGRKMVDSNKKTYRTEDLPFAAFLHASRRLRFLCCARGNSDGRIAFVFDDPKREGDRLHIEFESGAECPAVSFYDSVRHLRRVMTRVQSNGVMEYEQHRN